MPCSDTNVKLLKGLLGWETTQFLGVENCSVAMLYEMGSPTGYSESEYLYKHCWICRKNQLVRIVLRKLLGKIWSILLSSRSHCSNTTLSLLSGMLLRRSLQLQQPLGHGALFSCFLLPERKELAVSDTTLLQKLSFGSTEHLKGKIIIVRFVWAL